MVVFRLVVLGEQQFEGPEGVDRKIGGWDLRHGRERPYATRKKACLQGLKRVLKKSPHGEKAYLSG